VVKETTWLPIGAPLASFKVATTTEVKPVTKAFGVMATVKVAVVVPGVVPVPGVEGVVVLLLQPARNAIAAANKNDTENLAILWLKNNSCMFHLPFTFFA
jgi:hypothetical protein